MALACGAGADRDGAPRPGQATGCDGGSRRPSRASLAVPAEGADLSLSPSASLPSLRPAWKSSVSERPAAERLASGHQPASLQARLRQAYGVGGGQGGALKDVSRSPASLAASPALTAAARWGSSSSTTILEVARSPASVAASPALVAAAPMAAGVWGESSLGSVALGDSLCSSLGASLSTGALLSGYKFASWEPPAPGGEQPRASRGAAGRVRLRGARPYGAGQPPSDFGPQAGRGLDAEAAPRASAAQRRRAEAWQASSSTPAAPPCAGGDAASPAASPLQGAAAHLAAEGHAAAARSTPHARRSPSRPRPSKSPPPSGGGPAGFASAPAAATTEGAPCRRPRPPQELPSLGAARLPGEAPEARRATSSSSSSSACTGSACPPSSASTRFSNRSGRSTWSSSAASVATLGSASPSPAGGRDASRGAARAAAAASQQAPRRDRSLHEPPPSLGDAPPGGSPAPPSATRSASRTAGAEVQRRTAADHLPQKASLQAQRLSLRELGEEFRRCLEERGTAPRDGLPGGPPRRPATEEASSATAARPASREERMREVAESLGVPLKAVRSAHALFQEYAGDAAAAVAGDLRGGRAVGAAPGGGELGRAQFELLVEELSDMQPDPRRIAELREAFNQADAEDSGSISFDQFAVLLCKHSFSEFMIVDRICEREQNRKLARESGMTLVEVEDLRLDYRKYDENGDGTIDKEEFKLLLQDRLKVKLQDIPTTRVQHWWRCADENMDGTISFEEFIRFHRRFFGATRSKANPLDGFYRSGGLTGRFR